MKQTVKIFLKEKSPIFSRNESGSLSVFIIFLFLITLMLSFSIVDISGLYLAKRELINIAEPAISRAAHNVDLNRYYSGDRVQAGTNSAGPIYLVPIDCQAAAATLEAEIANITFRGSAINISQFTCQSDVLKATLQTIIHPTLAIPLLQGSVMNGLLTISATLSASNPIG